MSEGVEARNKLDLHKVKEEDRPDLRYELRRGGEFKVGTWGLGIGDEVGE